MRREHYLADADVVAFLNWVRPRLCQDGAFKHSWSDDEGPWSCSSIFDAYLRYRWDGADLERTETELARLAARLGSSYRDRNEADFLSAVDEVIRWGRVWRLKGRLDLDAWWGSLPSTLRRLDPATADTSDLTRVPMNSAYTKVYALLLPGFPMYDARVAAALGYLVVLFCTDTGRNERPSEVLRFSRSTQEGRTPGRGKVRFPSFYGKDGELRRAQSNVMAAWLCASMADTDCFRELPPRDRVRAVEAALFMIGNQVPDDRSG